MNIDCTLTDVYDPNMSNSNLHYLVEIVRNKILNLIDLKSNEGISLEKIGELCNLSKVQISTLRSKKRGANLSLNTALKIWTGLGHPPETLIADCKVDSLLAARIKKIQAGENRELFDLMLEVLQGCSEAEAGQLAVIRAALLAIRDAILTRKERPPAPGEKLSNFNQD